MDSLATAQLAGNTTGRDAHERVEVRRRDRLRSVIALGFWMVRTVGLTLLLALPGLAYARAGEAPDQLVRSVADRVLHILPEDHGPRAGHRSEFERLIEREIAPHFDFERMTRLALGRNWRLATAEQKKLLVERFSALLIHTYAAAFTSVGRGVTVTVEPVKLQPGDTDVLVRSLVKLAENPTPLQVDYSMYKSGQTWKVYDLSVNGVDLVVTYRDTFAEEISAGGIDGLLKSLQGKDAQVASRH